MSGLGLTLVAGGVVGVGFSPGPISLSPGSSAFFFSKKHMAQGLSQIRKLKWGPERVCMARDLVQSGRRAGRKPGAGAREGLGLLPGAELRQRGAEPLKRLRARGIPVFMDSRGHSVMSLVTPSHFPLYKAPGALSGVPGRINCLNA